MMDFTKNEKFAMFVDNLLKDKGFGEHIDSIEMEADTVYDKIKGEYVVECTVYTFDYVQAVGMFEVLKKVFKEEDMELDVDCVYDEFDNPLKNITYINIDGTHYYENLFK